MPRVLLLDVGGVVFRSAWELLDDYERWSGLLDDDHLNIEAANDAGMLGVLLDVTDPGPSVDVARRLVTRA